VLYHTDCCDQKTLLAAFRISMVQLLEEMVKVGFRWSFDDLNEFE